MNKCAMFIASLALPMTTVLVAEELTQEHLSRPIYDLAMLIPEIDATEFRENNELDGYQKIDDVAQYKMADWNNVIGIARKVTPGEAKKIADSNPDISFFFYMKGLQMVLETEDGAGRIFRAGDAVFFSGEPWWGSAPGFSDGYIKR